MSDERLIYLPMGGAGEIGMNAYVYGYGKPGKERLILVDVGITFPDMDGSPGVDVIMPDLSWLEAHAERLEAIFITHAHEDHVGALGYMWQGLGAPVYARRFTSAVARLKMEEAGHGDEYISVVEPRPAVVNAGPFEVQFVPVSHSIPESAALIIDTPAGRIIHSGDFKIDRSPVVGEKWDEESWQEIAAEKPVKALACDSTNVFSPHPGRSEASLARPLAELIGKAPSLVVATTFASNVARMKTLADAGVEAGRRICVLGRSMKRMLALAQEADVLHDFPPTLSPEEARDIPREELLILLTGSQGERRAAAAALSRGKYLGFELGRDDLFLFSSRTIPGNERPVIRIWNALSEKGVTVLDDQNGLYHVSGHANRPDLEHLHQLLKPAVLIPMHGEHRHLAEHARIGAEAELNAIVAPNGTMIDLTGEVPDVVDRVETGRVYLDGTALIGSMDGVVRDRLRMALNGHAIISLILDEEDTPLGEPWVELVGLCSRTRRDQDLNEVVEEELVEWLDRADRKTLRDDARIEEEMKRILRRVLMEEIGKKPDTTIIISRLAVED